MIEFEILQEDLSQLKSDWIKSEFEVLQEPMQFRSQLPVKGYIPDFLLRKGDKYTVVEVVQNRKHASSFRIDQIRKAIESKPNWSFVVYYLKDEKTSHDLPKPKKETVFEILRQAEHQINRGELISALLLAWSSLEAASRLRHPIIFAKPHTPSSLIAKLAERGHISPDTADSLRGLGKLRNMVVHGDYSAKVSPEPVRELISVVRELSEHQT